MFAMSWQATVTVLSMLPLLSFIAFRYRGKIFPIYRTSTIRTPPSTPRKTWPASMW